MVRDPLEPKVRNVILDRSPDLRVTPSHVSIVNVARRCSPLARQHGDRVAALGRRHAEARELPADERGLDPRIVGRGEAKRHVPVTRPRGEEERAGGLRPLAAAA